MSRSNSQSSIKLSDGAGTEPSYGVFGEQIATDIQNDIIINFQYNLSTRDVVTSTANGGSATQANSMAIVSSSTATNGSSYIQSINSLRYRSGHTAIAQFTAMFPNGGVAGSTQRIGPFDNEDGFYIGYNGTNLVVGYRNGGVDVEAVSSVWNGETSLSDFDFSKLNVFRIKFGWLGAAPITFEALKPGVSKWVTLHAFRLHSTITAPHIGNPALPIRLEVVKTSGSSNIQIKTGSWHAGIFGMSKEIGSRPFGFSTTKTLAANTNEQAIASFKSASTFQGKTNKVRAKLIRYTLHVDEPATGSGTVTFRFRKGATLGGVASYTDIDSTNSVVSTDTAQTFTSGGLNRVTEFVGYHSQGSAGSTGNANVDADLFLLYLDPGEVSTLTAQDSGGNGVTVRISYNWLELF